jgi:hypothetical protein
MLKKTACVLISLCSWVSMPAAAFDIVFDPNNERHHLENLVKLERQYHQLISHGTTLMNSYNQLKAKVDLDNLNLTSLSFQELSELIREVQSTVSMFDGHSTLAEISKLMPSSSNYASQRDAKLANHYKKPTDPKALDAQFGSSMDAKQLAAMKERNLEQQRNHQLMVDSVDQSQHTQEQAIKREKHIKTYGRQLEKLGDKSSLKTQQLTAAQINMSLAQNEQMIKQQNELLKHTRLQKAADESEKVKVAQAEEERLKKAMTQGDRGLGRERMGDL